MNRLQKDILPHDKNKLVESAIKAALVTVFIIFIVKLFSVFRTDSAALMASFVDSVLDMIVSCINLFALRYSSVPADDDHRFGHGKVQDLTVLVQTIFFLAFGSFVIFNAVHRFVVGYQEIQNATHGIFAMLFSSILSILLVTYQTYVAKVTNNPVVMIDRLHYASDATMCFIVMLSIYFDKELHGLDVICSVGIGIYILHGAFHILKKVLSNLLDEELHKDQRNIILDILRVYKNEQKIINVHDIKTRTSGNHIFIQFHLELNKDTTILHAHDIGELIEAQIMEQFPSAEVIIHYDPAGKEEIVRYKGEL